MTGITIPTHFRSPYLDGVLEAAKAIGPVVLVHTEPGHSHVPGITNTLDDRRNIQHWWNTGLDILDLLGETECLVLNDDLVLLDDTLDRLSTELNSSDLVYFAEQRGPRSASPFTGYAYGIRQTVIRPDPEFVWWYGDDDLYHRAVKLGLRVTGIPFTPGIRNHSAADAGEFTEQIRRDRLTFAQRWPNIWAGR